jgi:hypothetical protein
MPAAEDTVERAQSLAADFLGFGICTAGFKYADEARLDDGRPMVAFTFQSLSNGKALTYQVLGFDPSLLSNSCRRQRKPDLASDPVTLEVQAVDDGQGVGSNQLGFRVLVLLIQKVLQRM